MLRDVLLCNLSCGLTDVAMTGVETLKLGIVDRHHKHVSADDTQFQSVSSINAGALYAVRVYFSASDESLFLNPSKSAHSVLNLCNSGCLIL
jgi:hypothetical protein